MPRDFEVTVRFDGAAEPVDAVWNQTAPERGSKTVTDAELAAYVERLRHNAETLAIRPLTIRQIYVAALPESLREDLLSRLPFKEGQQVSGLTFNELATQMSQDPRVLASVKMSDGQVSVSYQLRPPKGSEPPAPPPPPRILQVVRIESSGLPEATRIRALQMLGITVGETLTLEEYERRTRTVNELPGVRVVMTGSVQKDDSKVSQIGLMIAPDSPKAASGPFADQLATITSIDASGLPEPLRQRVLDELGLREGESVSNSQLMQKMPAIKAIDRHVDVGLEYRTLDGPKLKITLYLNRDERRDLLVLPGPALRPIYTVPPEYPALARQARIQGTVRFELVVSLDGSVTNIHLVSGHPLLVQAAMDAVRQYRFPMSSSEVRTLSDVNFMLGH